MLALERRQSILDRIYRDRRVVVAELSAAFGVAEETIRRDLHKLEREGLIDRAHGGAVARESANEDLPYHMRRSTNSEAKQRIATLAAQLVHNGAALMLDSSSTAFEVLDPLRERRDITLITNSVRVIADPAATAHAVISSGGELRRRSMTFVGTLANQAIGQFNADLALISCKGLAVETGVMDASVPDAEVKRSFIAGARRVCLLVDGDKFDRRALITVCGIEAIDVIITDRRPPDPWPQALRDKGVELMF